MKQWMTLLFAASAAVLGSPAHAKDPGPPSYGALAVAEEAIVYGYPRVLMDATRRQMTTATTVPVGSWFGAPINQFRHAERVASPEDRAVVRPGTDTLYSSAWLDLSAEPLVLHLPEVRGRFYVMQMMDAWTNVFSAPGTRMTGTVARDIAILGPSWSGTLPAGVSWVRAPTNTVWIIGRTQILGSGDLPAARAVQQQFTLTPLSAWGRPLPAPVPPSPGIEPGETTTTPTTTPPEEVAQMDGLTFLRRLAEVWREDPVPSRDAAIRARLSTIGLSAGLPFEPRPEIAGILDLAKQRAEARIADASRRLGRSVNGWRIMLRGVGQYGTDYLTRAAVAEIGLGANLPQDAVYPIAFTDGAGRPLTGDRSYVLHFNRGQLPPVRAFWSLTLYDAAGYLVPNAINRYAVHDRDPLHYNPDGSLDIVLQSTSPGPGLESNWLPTPAAAPFNLTLRLYWPQPWVLSGAWVPPPVVQVVPIGTPSGGAWRQQAPRR